MSESPPSMGKKSRPGTVSLAVVLQLLLAVAMVVSGVLNFVYGADAQQAYEDELAAQGAGDSQLAVDSGGFEGTSNLVFPIVVAALMVVLALLNAVGNRVGRILSWVFQPLVLVCGGIVLAGSLFAVPLMQWGFDNAGDERLEGLDASALVEAAYGAFPAWSFVVDWAVALLATLGSLLVIILLAVPSSNAYFRKEAPPTYIPGAPTE